MPPKSKIWAHVEVQGEKDAFGNAEMQCKHWQKVFSSNANSFRHHLAGTGLNISACDMCPPVVAGEAQALLNRGQLQKQPKVKISRSRSGSESDLVTEEDPPPKVAKHTIGIKSFFAKQSKHEVRQ